MPPREKITKCDICKKKLYCRLFQPCFIDTYVCGHCIVYPDKIRDQDRTSINKSLLFVSAN